MESKQFGFTDATYSTAAVLETSVVDSSFPEGTDQHREDILVIYSIGAPTPIKTGRWFFCTDGIAAVEVSVDSVGSSSVIILGGYSEKEGGVHSLHLSGTSARGLSVNLVGLLLPEDDDLVFDGLHSAEVRGAYHIGRLKTKLTIMPGSLLTVETADLLEAISKQRKATAIKPNTNLVLSEPTDYIGGVPVPEGYDIKILGRVDGQEFGPLNGTTLVRTFDTPEGPCLDLVLTTEGPTCHGWSAWIAAGTDVKQERTAAETLHQNSQRLQEQTERLERRLSSLEVHRQELVSTVSTPHLTYDTEEGQPDVLDLIEAYEPGVSIRAKGGRLVMTATSAPVQRNLVWWTIDRTNPESEIWVTVETATIDLRFEGDSVTGSIEGQGYQWSSGQRQPSVFSANIKGLRHGAALLAPIVGTIGAQRFSGRWHDAALGAVALQQRSRSVQSTDGSDFIVEGVAINDILRFGWRQANGASGRGILRASRTGFLIGLFWMHEAQDHPSVIFARQEWLMTGPPIDEDVTLKLTSETDAIALKNLAYDHCYAGKYKSSSALLDRVVTFYKDKAKECDETDPAKSHSYLISQGLPLYTLVHNAFHAGDYPLLVKSLTDLLDLRSRRMSKGATRLRLLRQEMGRYTMSLRDTAETMGILTDAFQRANYVLTNGGIGVGVEWISGPGRLKVTRIAPNMPAARAGVDAGDTIVSIDGVSIGDSTYEQALRKLHGPPGIPVTLRLDQNGTQQDIVVTRVPLVAITSALKASVVAALQGLLGVTEKLKITLMNEVEAIEQLDLSSGTSPSVFTILGKRIIDLNAKLAHSVPAVIDLGRDVLGGASEAVALFDRFAACQSELLEAICETERMGEDVHARALKIDEEIATFKAMRSPNDFDANMVELPGNLLSSLQKLRFNLRNRRAQVDTIASDVESLPEGQKIAETLIKLNQWLENWRVQLATDAGKISALDESQEFYRAWIRVLVDMDLPEEALEASEAARARAFLDLVSMSTTQQPTQTSSEAETKPLSAVLNLAAVSYPKVAEIKALVRDTQTTVIEYFVLNNVVLTWVVTPTPPSDESASGARIHFHEEVFTSSSLGDFVDRLSNGLRQTGHEGLVADPLILSVLTELYAKLVDPVSSLLPEGDQGSVTIVPHDVLFQVPFAALPRPINSARHRFLIEDYILAFAPSVGFMKAVYEARRKRSQTKTPSLLAIVNPVFSTTVCDSNGRPFQTPSNQLQNSVEHIRSFYGPDTSILKGREATQTAVLTQAPTRDVVLFATHAEALAESPLNSYIALADGLLRVAALREGQWSAQLVMLTACETGRGRVSGDGVESVARMVAAAGAEAMITSLWKVPDVVTAELIYDFNRAWRHDRLNMAAAMRHALLRMAYNYGDQVRLWAGYILVGGWQ